MSRNEALVAAARGFAREKVAPCLAVGEWPAAMIRREAATLGLVGIEVPRAQGGCGAGFETRLAVCAALAEIDFGLALSLVNSHNVALRLAVSAPGASALPRILAGEIAACTAISEPGAGSDVSAMTTIARTCGEGWRLHGEKHWIVNAREAGASIVYARVEGTDGIAAFLVDLEAEGVTRIAQDSALSQCTTGTGKLIFDGARLASDSMILPPGAALPAILNEINLARIYVAAMCCGMVRAGIDTAAAYGEITMSFGTSLAGHQGWRFVLARAACDCDAADALVARAAAGQNSPEIRHLAASAKVVATAMVERHVPQLLHLMGARGLDPDLPLARHLAAVPVAGLVDGATEILLESVASAIRKRHIPTEDRKGQT